jgi:hypothetical protein
MLCKSQRDKDESQYCQRAAVSATEYRASGLLLHVTSAGPPP